MFLLHFDVALYSVVVLLFACIWVLNFSLTDSIAILSHLFRLQVVGQLRLSRLFIKINIDAFGFAAFHSFGLLGYLIPNSLHISITSK